MYRICEQLGDVRLPFSVEGGWLEIRKPKGIMLIRWGSETPSSLSHSVGRSHTSEFSVTPATLTIVTLFHKPR